jgi:hypothetical protein
MSTITTTLRTTSLTATLASLVLVGSGMLTSAATAGQETGNGAGASATAPDPDIDLRVAHQKAEMAAYLVEHGLFGVMGLAGARSATT